MTKPEFLSLPSGAQLAYHKTEGEGVGTIFMGGFMSDMTGSKATALEEYCRQEGKPFIRFDYQGHGESYGKFEEGTIGLWASDATAILDELTSGSQILIGSSMGGWLMLLATLARKERVAGLIGIASAPDFTENLIWRQMDAEQRRAIEEDGVYFAPSCYGDDPYPITKELIEEGRKHLLLEKDVPIDCPVHLIHGMKDPDVPWMLSAELAGKLVSDDVQMNIIKNGDHRMSSDEDIALLLRTLSAMQQKLN